MIIRDLESMSRTNSNMIVSYSLSLSDLSKIVNLPLAYIVTLNENTYVNTSNLPVLMGPYESISDRCYNENKTLGEMAGRI